MCHLIYIPFYVKSLWLKTFQGNRETMATDNDTIFLQYGTVWYVKAMLWYFYVMLKLNIYLE